MNMDLEEKVATHDSQIRLLFEKVSSLGEKLLEKMDTIAKELHLMQGRDDSGAILKLERKVDNNHDVIDNRVTILEKWIWAFGGIISYLGLDKVFSFFR
jgi:hypothetical protein